jgi:monoamine oxidase
VTEGVVVSSGDENYLGRKLIMAVPPPILSKIEFTPSLPPPKKRLIDSYFMGSVIKCYAIYDRPFWRKEGLNGLVATDSGFISVTFDNSPREGEVGMIMGFVLGEKAKEFGSLPEDVRKQHFLSELQNYLGEKAANAVYMDKVWADEEWSGGCYAGMLPVDAWTSSKHHLSEPFQSIHFAGTETATVWNGYMEGAVMAGRRAAEEVMDALDY